MKAYLQLALFVCFGKRAALDAAEGAGIRGTFDARVAESICVCGTMIERPERILGGLHSIMLVSLDFRAIVMFPSNNYPE